MTNVRSFIVGLIVLIMLFAGGVYVYQKSVKPTILDKNIAVRVTPTPVAKFTKEPTPSASPVAQTTQKTNVSITPSTGEDPENVGINLELHPTQNKIASPTVLTGNANVMDGIVNIQIKDANGNILGSTKANACMSANSCPFKTSFMFIPSQTTTGTLEAFANPTATNPQPYLQTVAVTF